MLGSFLLVSCGWNKETADIINPNAEYLYFYWATCPHCQELNKIAKEYDLYSKIEVEKKEVYRNRDNAEDFRKLAEKIGVNFNEVGVPFVYDRISGEVATGVKPAITLMTSRLGGKNKEKSQTTEDTTISKDEEQQEDIKAKEEKIEAEKENK